MPFGSVTHAAVLEPELVAERHYADPYTVAFLQSQKLDLENLGKNPLMKKSFALVWH
jgi:hypothetical protein